MSSFLTLGEVIPTPVPSLTSDPSVWLCQLCCATRALSYTFAADASSLPPSLLLLFLQEAAAVSKCSNDLQCIGYIFTKIAFKIHRSSPCPSSTSNSNQSCCVQNVYQLGTVLKRWGKKKEIFLFIHQVGSR